MILPQSAVPGIVWPAVPSGTPAGRLLALQGQLEETQWLAPAVLARRQALQLGQLLAHAYHLPVYRDGLAAAGYAPGDPVTPDLWARLPRLTRAQVQDRGEALRGRRLPPGHGAIRSRFSSGSTGQPIEVHASQIASLIWTAASLRDHFWHRRDFTGTVAVIRPASGAAAGRPEGLRQNNWGPSTALITATGPSVLLDIAYPVAHQAAWLERLAPDILVTQPSNLQELATHSLEQGIHLPSLKEVRTLGETLDPETRTLCRQAWGVGVNDVYSSREAGTIALQCPESEAYHIQSECNLVEVLDGDRPCEPGEVGQVVVTPLHNFALPLIRYEQADYAEVGAPCACGRGLPVLKRILGRARNFVTLPSGRQYWPRLGGKRMTEVAPIRQFQVVQKSLEQIELRLVATREVTPQEEEKLAAILRDRLGHPFAFRFTYLEALPRSKSGKYEEFRSELTDDST